MTREAAQKAMQLLIDASKALNEAARVVQSEAPEIDFHAYRRHGGRVLGAIYLDLMKPIAKFYPDLDPGREPGREENNGKQAKGET